MVAKFDPLIHLSDALAERANAASAFVVDVSVAGAAVGAGVLWRGDVVVASEQIFPEAESAELLLAGAVAAKARVAGRDRGTNIVALKLEKPVEASLPRAAKPRLGALALAVGSDGVNGPTVRLGVVSALGPAWHSRAGGLIDRRIALDMRLSRREEGGPVLDAAGGLLGIAAAGPRGRALVIPASTIDRVLEPLLATGRVDRAWLGLALHPVAVPEALRAETDPPRGLMVMEVSAGSPAAKAGILTGDILVALDGNPTTHPGRLSERLGSDSIGREAVLKLIRAGAPLSVTLTLEARPAG